jgi:RNA polymerase sigma factor (sigma-70 family)
MSAQERRLHGGSRPQLRFATDDRLVSQIRRGDATAFEILYDRHSVELLSFCRYMLDSVHDAEDAVQATFASAHEALLADERAITVRPWLFAVARNACLSILRQRRPGGSVDAAVAQREDPVALLEQREDLRHVLLAVRELPERQRTALVLAELHGLSQSEIAELLGVRPEQVKSYVFQARSSLISERRARGTDCREIREELATARGAALLKSHLRRHLRSCAGCRDYADALSRQRRQLGLLFPVVPSLALKRRALEAALGKSSGAGGYAGAAAGSSVAATTAELGGGCVKALLVKVLAGAAFLGAGTSVGAHLLSVPATREARAIPAPGSSRGARLQLAASVRPATPARSAPAPSTSVALQTIPHTGMPTGKTTPTRDSGVEVQQAPPAPTNSTINSKPAVAASTFEHGKSEEAHGKSGSSPGSGKSEEPHSKNEEAHGQNEEPHGKNEEAHGKNEEAHGQNEEAHGKNEEPHGKSEEPHGKNEEAHSKAEEPHGKP